MGVVDTGLINQLTFEDQKTKKEFGSTIVNFGISVLFTSEGLQYHHKDGKPTELIKELHLNPLYVLMNEKNKKAPTTEDLKDFFHKEET